MSNNKINKPKRPIDYLPDSPLEALEKAWEDVDVSQLLEGELRYWFYMALSHGSTVYRDADGDTRAPFIEFYDELLALIEASFCHSVQYLYYQQHKEYPDRKTMPVAIKARLCHDYTCRYITQTEQICAEAVYTRFCMKFELAYVRRELFDFLDAVEFYSGSFREKVSSHCFFHYYTMMLTIVEIAYVYLEMNSQPD